MERDEAIRLLTAGHRGVREWNQRRIDGAQVPDLRGVILQGMDLHGVDLQLVDLQGARLDRADLRYAKLIGLNLTDATLIRASLDGADLAGCKLHRANLTSAVLIGSDLSNADLRETTLIEIVFSGTKLDGADIHGATCGSSIFEIVDLSRVMGLDSIDHVGPSSIGVYALFQSRGKLPESFLRGCDVPDALIDYLPSLIGSMQPIQFYSCFISYSHKDEGFAKRLHSRLRDEKLKVWFAPEDMRGGRKSIEQIDQAIHVHDKLLLVLSKSSMESGWVRHEITRAVEREKREKCKILFPVGLAKWKDIKAWEAFDSDLGKDVAKVVREYHVPDFSDWKRGDPFESAFARLLADLKKEAEREAAS